MKKDQQNPDSVTPHKPEADETIDISRRRLAQASAAVAVLMTVANRPVMGASAAGCTLSAWMSAGSGPAKPTCGGFSTSYWKNKHSNWPSPCYKGGYPGSGWGTGSTIWGYNGPDKTPFYKDVCGSSPPVTVLKSNGQQIANPSLWEVLQQDANGGTLQGQFVAALLNAADDGVPYGYTVNDVINLYTTNASSNPDGLYKMFLTLNSRS